MRKPVVWLLSAYRSDSHAYWADWLCNTLTGYHWHKLELPGRHFRWRIRGNPLSWIDSLPNGTPDLILATSMVDLATIKGIHPRLADVYCIYYFHENQFAYPPGEHQVKSIDPQMVQFYGALAADACLFNSSFNLESFLSGCDQLLDTMPDQVPAGINQRIRNKSAVLPVPVQSIDGHNCKQDLIVWNHRWEYDKAPELFADAVIALAANGIDFKLALLGSRPDRTPAALQRIRDSIPSHIEYDQKASDTDYRTILANARIVVSTAIHEFQGISVLQAVSAGAIPVVPDALCYREQFDSQYRYTAGDQQALVEKLQHWLAAEHADKINIDAWLAPGLQPAWADTLTNSLSKTRMILFSEADSSI
jgi:glycosyltransferase involved in cell wall biosynthesis